MDDAIYSAKPSCQLDAEIGNYILSNPSGDFSKLLSLDERWEVFCHLSNRQAGLLCWYPFRENASLLQIGGGFGALTGMLCDRCKAVTVLEHDAYRARCIQKRWNSKSGLRILQGGIPELSPDSVFDYIVLIAGKDSSEPAFSHQGYVSLLRKVKSLLAPDGKLLFAVPNRLGLQYFCGVPDACTGIPFDGINDYPAGAAMPSLSRPEVLEVLAQAGFPKTKLYYPFPDHLLPQIIYTDEYPPGEELNERLRPYQATQDSLVIDANNLYEPLITYGVMTLFSNSFLAECGNDDLCDVEFVTVSTERGREESYSTAIIGDKQVEKRPLYSKEMFSLKRLCGNLNDLKNNGIPAISCRLENDRLVMPRIASPKLSNHIRKLVLNDHDIIGFFECMDRLYQYILQSSEHVSAEKNALSKLNPNSDWGPILSKAYLEMIPVNCFYDNGEFLFFDQEFVKENYPAKYVMFRAINDIYNFAIKIEQYVSCREMQKRYGLTELWPFFEKEENCFQDSLRQRKKYRQFYKWTLPDIKNIMRNGRLLLMDNKPEQIHVNRPNRMFAAVDGAERKSIVLFGSGRMMDHYINKYGTTYPPSFVVDNDESKWNTEKLGFPIRSPQILCELTPGHFRVIICNGAYPEIADQLMKMGINDYRIYVKSFDELLESVEIRENRNEKYNIGYVTGVFDLFHIGHLNILRRSKERCEYLIVGVLTDEICIKEKGNKPFIPFEERMEIVRHIDFVDRVVPVDDHNTDKLEAWKQYHFDCFFSGSDHDWYWLEKQLQSLGSDLETFPYTQSTNSTELRELIKKSTK